MKASKSQAGTIGALRLHATHDSKLLTVNARAASRTALENRLLAEIDPEHQLDDVERARRLKYAWSAYFRQMRLKR